MAKSSTTPRRGRSTRSARQSQQPQDDNRAQYEREADALITLLELEFGETDEGADLGDLKERPLMNGVRRHMRELFRRADFLNPLTLRRFYVELRLWGDVLAAAEAQGMFLVKESDLSE